MIIDSHTHIGFGGAITASPEELLASMDKAEIDMALVFAGGIAECPTEKLIETLAPFRDRLLPIGSIAPLSSAKPSPSVVADWLEEKRIFGLKFYPGYEYFYPFDEAVRPYLEVLRAYRKPAVFHSGETYRAVPCAKLRYAHPLHIDEIAVAFPEVPIVVAHMGYPWIIDAAEVAFKNTNVYVDCSGLVEGEWTKDDEKWLARFFRLFEEYGGAPEKILFGTDWPISAQKPYKDFLHSFDVDADAKEHIFSKNALEIFGIV